MEMTAKETFYYPSLCLWPTKKMLRHKQHSTIMLLLESASVTAPKLSLILFYKLLFLFIIYASPG